MDDTRSDFENRKNEIEEYFRFLVIFNHDDIQLRYNTTNKTLHFPISRKLQTMFIANAFLILYNLIEATIRNSIIDIYDKIKEDDISYKELSENLKLIWVKQQTTNLKQGAFQQVTLQKGVYTIAESILTKETIKLTSDSIDISGNIDAQKIRELASKIGFTASENGRSLVGIKEKRNRLAHGEHTFHEVGKDFTPNELNDFKLETFSYLTDVMDKIESFIDDEAYKS